MVYNYRDSVLSELIRHGIKPTRETPPAVVHDFINDLYLYEIRTLRRRMRAGLIPKNEYASHVVELRKRYAILSLPVEYWTEPEGRPQGV